MLCVRDAANSAHCATRKSLRKQTLPLFKRAFRLTELFILNENKDRDELVHNVYEPLTRVQKELVSLAHRTWKSYSRAEFGRILRPILFHIIIGWDLSSKCKKEMFYNAGYWRSLTKRPLCSCCRLYGILSQRENVILGSIINAHRYSTGQLLVILRAQQLSGRKLQDCLTTRSASIKAINLPDVRILLY